jgi:uncharacterized protein (DUF302 family)
MAPKIIQRIGMQRINLMLLYSNNESRRMQFDGYEILDKRKWNMGKEPASNLGIKLNYGYGRTLDLPFDVAVQRTRDSLKSEGFGVLCEIDIKEKLKEKIGVNFANYVILGACNPPLAYQALQQEMDLGLLLPCNVVVYEKGGKSFVAAIDAARMLSIVGNSALEATASHVNEKLRHVIDAL